MLDHECLALLDQEMASALRLACQRVERALEARDVEATVGAAKDLVESAAKVVIDSLGGTYGSTTDLNQLASKALDAVALHPRGMQDRPALRRVSQAFVSAVTGVTELRNTDGTGHGRARSSDLEWRHAALVRDAAQAWTSWVLTTASQLLGDRAAVDQAVNDVRRQVFHSGDLPNFLMQLSLEGHSVADQRRLGIAVARRWTVGETFLAHDDVVHPVAKGQTSYPEGFREGLVEGLLLDYDGYLHTSPVALERAIEIGVQLPDSVCDRVFKSLAESLGGAEVCYVFDMERAHDLLSALSGMRGRRPAIDEALSLIAETLGDYVDSELVEE
jgi:hypothetical protein